MENMIEQTISNNSRCYTCGGLVYAVEKKRTTNHTYHSRCFRCRICKRSLNQASLNEEGDEIYCTNCYRKKQRGDCNSLEFQRAAAEKAQYVYDQHHPDLPKSQVIPKLPNKPDFLRHPSLTLRKLERNFLSLQEQRLDQSKNNAGSTQTTYPIPIRTYFSSPSSSKPMPTRSSFGQDERSSLLHFSPATSLSLRQSLDSTAGASKRMPQFNEVKPIYTQNQALTRSSESIYPRSTLFNSDLGKPSTPLFNRKLSLVPELNEDTQKKDQQSSSYEFSRSCRPARRLRSKSVSFPSYRHRTK